MSYSSNDSTGQITTDTTWQLLPVQNSGRDWMLYIEGDEVLMYIGGGNPDTVGTASAFKVPAGAAFRWYSVVQPVYIKGVDITTVVYYIK